MIDYLYSDSYKNYPKQYVAIDCVIFGYENEELKLLLHPRQLEPSIGNWSLLGGFVHDEESMEVATRRVLLKTTGLENIYLEQVQAFSEPNRDPGGRVISMAFYALIRIEEHDKELVNSYGARWWSITDLPPLIFDHGEMVKFSLEKLQRKASSELVGKELLPEMFTLTQLHNLYNAIFQKPFDAGNFRKKLNTLNALDRTDLKETAGSKKGAFYYKFKKDYKIDTSDRVVKF